MQTPKCYHMAEAKETLLTNSINLLFLFYLYYCLSSGRGSSSLGVDFCLCSLLFAVFGGYSPGLLA